MGVWVDQRTNGWITGKKSCLDELMDRLMYG